MGLRRWCWSRTRHRLPTVRGWSDVSRLAQEQLQQPLQLLAPRSAARTSLPPLQDAGRHPTLRPASAWTARLRHTGHCFSHLRATPSMKMRTAAAAGAAAAAAEAAATAAEMATAQCLRQVSATMPTVACGLRSGWRCSPSKSKLWTVLRSWCACRRTAQ